MSDPITSAAEEVAKETTRGIFTIVGGPNAGNSVIALMCIIFVMGGFAFAGVGLWIFNKSQDANNGAVRASTDAITSNSETVRRMGNTIDNLAKTVDEIKDTEKGQSASLEESKRDRIVIMDKQNTILSQQNQTFSEHKILMESARQGLNDHKTEIELLTNSKNKAGGG